MKTKRIAAILFTLVMTLTLLASNSVFAAVDPSKFSGGTGTQEDPYQIQTLEQLEYFMTGIDDNSGYRSVYFKLTADIDMSGKYGSNIEGSEVSWVPNESDFQGTFYGDGHKITGLYINNKNQTTGNNQGFFGRIGKLGTVKGLSVTGSVSAVQQVGGIAGNSYGKILNCSNGCSVTGAGSGVGGIVGYQSGNSYYVASVENCFNTGDVKGTAGNGVGGIVGYSYSVASVKNCYNIGNISGMMAVGTIIGNNSTVENCFYTGTQYSIGGDYIGNKPGVAEKKTVAEFKSGEVAVKLQGNQTELVWGQLLGTDDYPVLGGKRVVADGDGYKNVEDTVQEDPEALKTLIVVHNMNKVTKDAKDYYPIHIYAGIDSLDYSKVGFKVEAKNNNGTVNKSLDSMTVYEEMTIIKWDGTTEQCTPDKLGGEYMFGHEMLFSIENRTNDNTEISVTPYAVTLDGTEVDGRETKLSDSIIKEKDATSALFREEN